MTLLEEASQVVEDIICAADLCTGRAKCKLMRDKFVYLDDKQVRWYLLKIGCYMHVFSDVSLESSPSRLKRVIALTPYCSLEVLVLSQNDRQFEIFEEFLGTFTSWN